MRLTQIPQLLRQYTFPVKQIVMLKLDPAKFQQHFQPFWHISTRYIQILQQRMGEGGQTAGDVAFMVHLNKANQSINQSITI